jgi:hypothetical protein
VERILTQPEVEEMRSQYKQRLFSFVPKALDVVDEALSSDDERIRFTAAIKLLEAVRLMPRRGDRPEEPRRVTLEELVCASYGTSDPEECAPMIKAEEEAKKSVSGDHNPAISGDPRGLKAS